MSVIEPIETPGPSASGGNPMNPKTAKRIAAFGTIVVILFGVLIVRLWFLQVVGGRGFEAAAVGNSVRTIFIPAPRGEILDRNGVVLAGSRPAWDIVALPKDLENTNGDRTLKRLARVIDENPRRLERKVAVGAKRAPYKSVVLKADLDEVADGDLLLSLRERISEYPGIRLERTYRRDYPFKSSLGHVLGYVGPITENEIDERRRQGYRNDAIVGRDGLEQRYEEFLKGTDGERRVEVDAAGQPVGRGTISERPPKPGLTLKTTIDIHVQQALEDALREQVELKSERTAGAGGVVLNARTGEVVALASYPAVDPRVYTRGRAREVRAFERNPRLVHLDRALWSYPPGSTFKPITAVAALNAGILAPDDLLTSPKRVFLYGRYFNNFRNLELQDMSVRRAITMSSDTFFYQVGAKLYAAASKPERLEGDNKLKYWAQQLGLGRSTRIDLPSEQGGDVPDRAWKRRNLGAPIPVRKRERDWDSWRPGDTINMSIGQGYVRASPLQMARAYAALVNGGKLLTPTVGWAVVDPVSERQVSDLAKGRPETALPEIRPEVLDAVLGGMYDATNGFEGTASAVFSRLGGLVAGKTGTAENGENRRDHSWFVGYGPASSGSTPEYVVAVVVENAGLGAQAAAPAACKALAPALGYNPGRCGRGGSRSAAPGAGGD